MVERITLLRMPIGVPRGCAKIGETYDVKYTYPDSYVFIIPKCPGCGHYHEWYINKKSVRPVVNMEEIW